MYENSSILHSSVNERLTPGVVSEEGLAVIIKHLHRLIGEVLGKQVTHELSFQSPILTVK